MFDLLPFKRRGEAPNVFAEMDGLVKRMWYGFPFHNLQEDLDIGWSPRLDVSEEVLALRKVDGSVGQSRRAGSGAEC